MAENSTIEWTDHTFNPWVGCTKVSPGCDNCYAEARMDTRLHRVHWGAGQPRERTKTTWKDPGRWNKAHPAFFAAHDRRQRVFCASLADVFDNQVSEDWRADLFELIEATPNLDWQLLTKRVGNVAGMVPYTWTCQRRGWPAHVRVGATMVNQEEWDRDIDKLLALSCANFVSLEPLLGPIDMRGQRPDWVIVGGESGHGARPTHPEWARSLRDQCAAAGVPFLFKQWGEWIPISQQGNGDGLGCSDFPGYAKAPICVLQLDGEVRQAWPAGAMLMRRVGKKAAGRLLDGVTHDGFPGAP